MILSARLAQAVRRSETLAPVLEALPALGLPNAYIAAGCVVQTVWNLRFGMPDGYGIDDVDIVYFDPDDLTKEAEELAAARAHVLLPETTLWLDVKNEARVHLWYHERFGYPIAPYASCEDAIRSFPTTATAVGIRPKGEDLCVFAPYGLEDLFGGIVRANKVQVSETVYRAKAEKWKGKWPGLEVIPW